MPEDIIKITVEVNGKVVPISSLSEETLCNIRKADAVQRIPVASLGKYGKHHDRILLKVTPEIKSRIAQEYSMVSINLRTGECDGYCSPGDEARWMHCNYTDVQDLTPKD